MSFRQYGHRYTARKNNNRISGWEEEIFQSGDAIRTSNRPTRSPHDSLYWSESHPPSVSVSSSVFPTTTKGKTNNMYPQPDKSKARRDSRSGRPRWVHVSLLNMDIQTAGCVYLSKSTVIDIQYKYPPGFISVFFFFFRPLVESREAKERESPLKAKYYAYRLASPAPTPRRRPQTNGQNSAKKVKWPGKNTLSSFFFLLPILHERKGYIHTYIYIYIYIRLAPPEHNQHKET